MNVMNNNQNNQYQQPNGQQNFNQYQQPNGQQNFNQYQQPNGQQNFNQYQQPNGQQNYNQYQQGGGAQGFVDKVKDFIINTPVAKDAISPQDIADNKTMCIFAYIGILFLIPLLACKNSRYARFHANQGLIFFLFAIVLGIADGILSIIFSFIPILGVILNILLGLVCYVLPLGYMILGIYNAVKGRANELPIIGKIRIIKTVVPEAVNYNVPNNNFNNSVNNNGVNNFNSNGYNSGNPNNFNTNNYGTGNMNTTANNNTSNNVGNNNNINQ